MHVRMRSSNVSFILFLLEFSCMMLQVRTYKEQDQNTKPSRGREEIQVEMSTWISFFKWYIRNVGCSIPGMNGWAHHLCTSMKKCGPHSAKRRHSSYLPVTSISNLVTVARLFFSGDLRGKHCRDRLLSIINFNIKHDNPSTALPCQTCVLTLVPSEERVYMQSVPWLLTFHPSILLFHQPCHCTLARGRSPPRLLQPVAMVLFMKSCLHHITNIVCCVLIGFWHWFDFYWKHLHKLSKTNPWMSNENDCEVRDRKCKQIIPTRYVWCMWVKHCRLSLGINSRIISCGPQPFSVNCGT